MRYSNLYLLILGVLLALNVGCKHKKAMVDIYDPDNLFVWAFVPFDPVDRTAEDRAMLLKRLGFVNAGLVVLTDDKAFIEEHVIAYRENGIQLVSMYCPIQTEDPLSELQIQNTLEVIEEQGCETQLWVHVNTRLLDSVPEENRVERSAALIKPVLERAISLNCRVALYNHGGWTGDPRNLVRIIDRLRLDYGAENIGLAFNFHHAHEFIPEFPSLFKLMEQYLFAVNTNGMKAGGPKIVPLGEGEEDLSWLKIVKESGYDGPIGIIHHVGKEDPEIILQKNLDGLRSIVDQLKYLPIITP